MTQDAHRRTWPYLLGGVAVGVAFGVLFAPKPGRETRRDMAEWLKEKRWKTREFLSKFREKIPAKKEQWTAALKAGKQAYQEHKHEKELAGV